MMPAGRPAHTLSPGGRDPWSSAFFRTPDRSIIFGRDEQHAVGLRNRALQPPYRLGRVCLLVLVVEWQVADGHVVKGKVSRCQAKQRVVQSPVERIAPQAADDRGDAQSHDILLLAATPA
jgi:hypothetical protein